MKFDRTYKVYKEFPLDEFKIVHVVVTVDMQKKQFRIEARTESGRPTEAWLSLKDIRKLVELIKGEASSRGIVLKQDYRTIKKTKVFERRCNTFFKFTAWATLKDGKEKAKYFAYYRPWCKSFSFGREKEATNSKSLAFLFGLDEAINKFYKRK